MEYPESEGTHKNPQTLIQESRCVPESVVQPLLGTSLLETCEALCCDHCPEKPVPVPSHPLGEESYPDIQHKLFLACLLAVSLGPITA